MVFFLTSNTKHFLTNSATNTAVLCLFVPLRTQGICEISPDAIHKTVRIALTMSRANLLFLCNIQHGAWRNVNIKKSNSKYRNFETTFKIFAYELFGSFWYQTFSLRVVMIYSAMVPLWLMKYLPSDVDITPFISPTYSSKFSIAPNSNMNHFLPLKFRKIFLSDLNLNFRLVSGGWEYIPCIICWQVTGTASELSQWLRRMDRQLQREAETITIPWCQSRA